MQRKAREAAMAIQLRLLHSNNKITRGPTLAMCGEEAFPIDELDDTDPSKSVGHFHESGPRGSSRAGRVSL